MSDGSDPRLQPPAWDPAAGGATRGMRILLLLAVPLALWYFGWLLQPQRIGQPELYGLLIAAEVFNLVQACGFWWTVAASGREPLRGNRRVHAAVDVLIPVYDEPIDIVEPTVDAATRMRGAEVTVHVLDDGERDSVRLMAERCGARYIRRASHTGAKAGNINHALERTSAPFILVLDCDHVPGLHFLERTLPLMGDEWVAFVQTPQYYANGRRGGIAAAAWAQQALFFGAIARGKDAWGSMFCCGTNVLLRRTALMSVGGFPTGSLTEDFELSIHLRERGWTSRYVPEVLAQGLGPEDMSSYVSQQQRWARGCIGGAVTALRARMPLRVKAQYLLSSMYFLSGWTLLAYMSFPIVRILTGAQPIADASADQFLLHFAPYFAVALGAVAVAGAGCYTFAGFSLAAANFWIHLRATVLALARRRGRFVVTPKRGALQRQPKAVLPGIAAITVLVGVAVYGIVESRAPSTLNNAAFAAFHATVLGFGIRYALVRRREGHQERREDSAPEPDREPELVGEPAS
jgi:Glycosyl transferase family group 2